MVSATYAERDVRVGDLTLHYLEWGKPDAPPVVMLHGFGLSGHMFDEFAERMHDRYRLIALDQRGHGDSEWSEDGNYSREAFATDLEGVADALGLERFVLVGHSMGGLNSVEFASKHPERLNALVLVDVGPEAAKEGVESIQQFTQMPDEVDFDDYVKRTMAFNPRRTEENIRERLQHRLKPTESGKWTWKFDRRLRQKDSGVRVGSEQSTEDSWSLFRSVEVPTLLVRGAESDILKPDVAQRTVTEMSRARLVVVPDAGHSVPGDNPEAFTNAVSTFLTEVETGNGPAANDGALPLEDAVERQAEASGRPRPLFVIAAAGLAIGVALGAAAILAQRRKNQKKRALRSRARRAAGQVPHQRDDLAAARERAAEVADSLTGLARNRARQARSALREADVEQARRTAFDLLHQLEEQARHAPEVARKAQKRRRSRFPQVPRLGRRRSPLQRVLSTAGAVPALAANAIGMLQKRNDEVEDPRPRWRRR